VKEGKSMARIAEELVKVLYSMGVRYAFGIPGGPSIPYLEAMRNEGIQFVTVANEQSAGMMADVFGRLTGIPGVCHATFGPGATNLSTGVGGAFLDRSPIMAFTTEVKDEDIGRKIQMNIDHQALFKPITKWTTRLSKDNFQYTVHNAYKIAASEIPGPVHIGLPVDICDYYVDTVGRNKKAIEEYIRNTYKDANNDSLNSHIMEGDVECCTTYRQTP